MYGQFGGAIGSDELGIHRMNHLLDFDELKQVLDNSDSVLAVQVFGNYFVAAFSELIPFLSLFYRLGSLLFQYLQALLFSLFLFDLRC